MIVRSSYARRTASARAGRSPLVLAGVVLVLTMLLFGPGASAARAGTGAPITAVMIPTGNSVGAMIRRAARSAITTTSAPTNAAGTMHAPGERTSRRAIGPATNATNAIGPAAATPSAASATPTHTSASFERETRRPSAAAMSSPSSSRSSERCITMASGPSTSRAGQTTRTCSHERPLSDPVSHTAARWTSVILRPGDEEVDQRLDREAAPMPTSTRR